MEPFIYPRTAYAANMAESLVHGGIVDFSSGLFLAARRRTGKSTFLRRDLIPALAAREVLPIYVDLWADQQADPATLIMNALKLTMIELQPAYRHTLSRVGVKKIGLGSFASIDLDRIGQEGGATLADALRSISEQSGKRIALIVDEAQHALTSDNGINAMYALKSARDVMNNPLNNERERSLILVFTGSNQDKLASLVSRKEQPFFGASITPFRLLGREFTDAFTRHLNAQLSHDGQVSPDALWTVFDTLDRRPERLREAIANVVFADRSGKPIDDALIEAAQGIKRSERDGLRQDILALSPLQRAVLTRLAETGQGFAPFASASLDEYARVTGAKVSASEAQSALDGLREKEMVWRSERGVYLLEDPQIGDALQDEPASQQTMSP